ncbi:unnamed protein product [Aphanomyces euteiches]
MKFVAFIAAIITVATESVLGASVPGLAAGTTGGGSAIPVYPKTIAELKFYLNDTIPRVVILNKAFDFRGSENTTTETGCRPERNLIGQKLVPSFQRNTLISNKKFAVENESNVEKLGAHEK